MTAVKTHKQLSFNWIEKDLTFTTILGESSVKVQMMEKNGKEILRSDEETRARKIQIIRYLEYIIKEKENMDPDELRYILRTLEVTQKQLASKINCSASAISNFFAGQKLANSTHQHIGLILLLETKASIIGESWLKPTTNTDVNVIEKVFIAEPIAKVG